MKCEQQVKEVVPKRSGSTFRSNSPKSGYTLSCYPVSHLNRKSDKPIVGITHRYFKKFTIALVVMLLVCANGSYAMNEAMVNRIADAIYKAENSKSHPYGIVSVKCTSAEECRTICKNTIRNNWKRYLHSDKKLTYLEFLASRYAPIGVANDPTNLNQHWLKNVQFFLYGGV